MVDARSLFHQIRGIVFAALFAAAVLYLLLALGSAPAPEKLAGERSTASVPAGSEGQLQNGKPVIPVAIDEELLPQMAASLTAADYSTALSDLGGRVFLVDNATSIRVSETGVNGIRVRILTGSQKGRLGWVPVDWVKPI
jgi:hypothetical protein